MLRAFRSCSAAARGAEVVVTALVIRDAAAIANAEPIGDLGLREGEPLSDSAQLVPIAVAVGGRACTTTGCSQPPGSSRELGEL